MLHCQILFILVLLLATLSPACYAKGSNDEADTHQNKQDILSKKWGADRGFSGIVTFAHLPHKTCLASEGLNFDIAIIGAPFDTATSYRPGARFGPRAVRDASMRMSAGGGYNVRASHNPLASWANVVDCGDIPVTPYDNALAMRQMMEAYKKLGHRKSTRSLASSSTSKAAKAKPVILTIGGDHSISLPILRALKEVYKAPVSVVHFDAHMDTWAPDTDGPWHTKQSDFNHGSVFWHASQEGLICKRSSVHVGLRSRLVGTDQTDYDTDDMQGFFRIASDHIDTLGVKGISSQISAWVGSRPVYLSVDIDVLDPAQAPGTGTPEVGGWTSRELIHILRDIEGLNIIGADIVEVSPPYDSAGQVTALAASQIIFEILTSISKRGLQPDEEDAFEKSEL